MIWIICLICSISIISFTIIGLIIAKSLHKNENKNINGLTWLVTATFLASTIVFLPIYIKLFDGERFQILRSIILSFHNALKLFVVDADFSFVTENLVDISSNLKPVYSAYLSILFIISPIFTFGFVLTFFKNFSAKVKYIFNFFSDVYIFSELNERSLALAKDLKKNNRKRLIVFCDVFEKNEESSAELMSEVNAIGAVCFNKDILNINFKFHSIKKIISFFIMGLDQDENISQTLKLGEVYGDVPNSHLYIFSNDTKSELLVSSIKCSKMKIRRINESQSLINNELYTNPGKLFSKYNLEKNGMRKISAVIVGTGIYGLEMLKTLIWFGQMDNYLLEINAFDKSKDAEDTFAYQCPEIVSPKYNGFYKEGEPYYKVKVHSDTNVDNISFANKLKDIKDITYIFVSLGSDEMNIKVAAQLRALCERMKIEPLIQAIVYNTSLIKNLKGLKNFNNEEYKIDFIGDLETVYSEKVIIDSELEKEAMVVHRKSKKPEIFFWQYEYYYRSSIASAIHNKAKEACKIPGANKNESELTKEEKKVIGGLEHRRWNAYMRSIGYVYSGSKQAESRNDLGKMHHSLVDYDSISDIDKEKDIKIGTK